uniref:Snf2-related CREBBP activator protein n=1 Tax=Petromyzon marinus TaxID=7757 RepID=S4R6R0_PETMA
IEEQEGVEGTVCYQQELDELAREGEMPLEDLYKMYASAYEEQADEVVSEPPLIVEDVGEEVEVKEMEPKSQKEVKNDDNKPVNQVQMEHFLSCFLESVDSPTVSNRDENEDQEMEGDEEGSDLGMKFLVTDDKEPQSQAAEEGADGVGPKKEITDIAAAAESLQPKGYTLATAQVKTPVPFLLRGSLREYQHIGLDWLVTMNEKMLNGILADEMGLGKTIQTIALLGHLACDRGNWGPHLVVVPTSVMLNWEMEFKRWFPAFKILTYYGVPKERKQKRQGWTRPNAFHVCITSYKLVLQDHQAFRRKKWKYLILDEAQNIKNFKSQRYTSKSTVYSQHRLLLTGTPLQNSLMELWSLMHFLMPHVFQSHREFREWFSNPLTGMIEGSQEYNESLVKRLHKVLRPFLLRRIKMDVEKQMPKKYEHIVRCRLSKRQRYLYDDFMSQATTRETLASGHFMSVINILMQLRKVCNHPNLFDPRPITSPFITQGICYTTASLVLTALEYDPWRHVDLSIFDLVNAENQLSRYEAEVFLPNRKVTRKLIEEISTAPDPPPRPKPVRMKVNRMVQPVQKSEGRTVVMVNAPKSLVQNSLQKPLPSTATDGIVPTASPAAVGVVPEVAGAAHVYSVAVGQKSVGAVERMASPAVVVQRQALGAIIDTTRPVAPLAQPPVPVAPRLISELTQHAASPTLQRLAPGIAIDGTQAMLQAQRVTQGLTAEGSQLTAAASPTLLRLSQGLVIDGTQRAPTVHLQGQPQIRPTTHFVTTQGTALAHAPRMYAAVPIQQHQASGGQIIRNAASAVNPAVATTLTPTSSPVNPTTPLRLVTQASHMAPLAIQGQRAQLVTGYTLPSGVVQQRVVLTPHTQARLPSKVPPCFSFPCKRIRRLCHICGFVMFHVLALVKTTPGDVKKQQLIVMLPVLKPSGNFNHFEPILISHPECERTIYTMRVVVVVVVVKLKKRHSVIIDFIMLSLSHTISSNPTPPHKLRVALLREPQACPLFYDFNLTSYNPARSQCVENAGHESTVVVKGGEVISIAQLAALANSQGQAGQPLTLHIQGNKLTLACSPIRTLTPGPQHIHIQGGVVHMVKPVSQTQVLAQPGNTKIGMATLPQQQLAGAAISMPARSIAGNPICFLYRTPLCFVFKCKYLNRKLVTSQLAVAFLPVSSTLPDACMPFAVPVATSTGSAGLVRQVAPAAAHAAAAATATLGAAPRPSTAAGCPPVRLPFVPAPHAQPARMLTHSSGTPLLRVPTVTPVASPQVAKPGLKGNAAKVGYCCVFVAWAVPAAVPLTRGPTTRSVDRKATAEEAPSKRKDSASAAEAPAPKKPAKRSPLYLQENPILVFKFSDSSAESDSVSLAREIRDPPPPPVCAGNVKLRVEELRAQRQEDRLERIHRINEARCAPKPIYGTEVLRMCDLSNSAAQPGVRQSCKPSHPDVYWSQTSTLQSLCINSEQRLRELKEIIERFIFVVPPVESPPISLHAPHPPPSMLQKEKALWQRLHEEMSPRSAGLHRILCNMRTQFPDLRLIQYDCGKLQTLDILLRKFKAGSHRVLIFTQMTRMLDVLEQFLNFHGYIYLRLDGTTRVEQRQFLMDRFNADARIFCFILSTRSGGVGVNLTGADTVVFYDSDWNPTMDAQAQDRCHRIGQTRDVHIYRLISERTVEENILKKANQKRMLGDVAIEGGNFTTAYFKQQTIRELFEMPVGMEDASKKEAAEAVPKQAPSTEEDGAVPSKDTNILELALGKAEDEEDIRAASQARAEQVAELAEFNENAADDGEEGGVGGEGRDEEEPSKAEEEINALVQQLTPIERYALKYLEASIAAETEEPKSTKEQANVSKQDV